MCKLCNGEGGITLVKSWGVEYVPCNHPDCDFDREKAWAETQAIIDRKRKEIAKLEGATS